MDVMFKKAILMLHDHFHLLFGPFYNLGPNFLKIPPMQISFLKHTTI